MNSLAQEMQKMFGVSADCTYSTYRKLEISENTSIFQGYSARNIPKAFVLRQPFEIKKKDVCPPYLDLDSVRIQALRHTEPLEDSDFLLLSSKTKAFHDMLGERMRPLEDAELIHKYTELFADALWEGSEDFSENWEIVYEAPAPKKTKAKCETLARESVSKWEVSDIAEAWKWELKKKHFPNEEKLHAYVLGVWGELEADETPKNIAMLTALNLEPSHLTQFSTAPLKQARKDLTAWLVKAYSLDPTLLVYHAGRIRR